MLGLLLLLLQMALWVLGCRVLRVVGLRHIRLWLWFSLALVCDVQFSAVQLLWSAMLWLCVWCSCSSVVYSSYSVAGF